MAVPNRVRAVNHLAHEIETVMDDAPAVSCREGKGDVENGEREDYRLL
jgi:hypothetical protein